MALTPLQRFFVLVLMASLVLAVSFYVLTSEVFDLQVGSGVWAFYLVFAFLLLIMSLAVVVRTRKAPKTKASMVAVMLALVGAMIGLGLRHQPFSAENVRVRLGAKPIFGDEVEAPPDSYYDGIEPPPEIDWRSHTPPPVD